jgi:hypothetical protein
LNVAAIESDADEMISGINTTPPVDVTGLLVASEIVYTCHIEIDQ